MGTVCLLIGCSASPTIRSEANPMATFAAYQTYGWTSAGSPKPPGEHAAGLVDWRVRNAVDASLRGRGWTPSDGPDVLIDYGVAVQEMNTDSFSDYARYVQEGGRQGLSEAFVSGYQQGTLSLYMYDARTRQLVWRAAATAVVGGSDNDEVVRSAVQQMVDKLPR